MVACVERHRIARYKHDDWGQKVMLAVSQE
jgi:signal transduction histidine kinase